MVGYNCSVGKLCLLCLNLIKFWDFSSSQRNVVFWYLPPYSLVKLVLRGRLLSPSSVHKNQKRCSRFLWSFCKFLPAYRI
jgi:hypothetical protein